MSSIKDGLKVFGIISLVGIVLYFPILDNTFLSDDYDSLYRICIEKNIIVKEFLRPVIDVSFKLNYYFGGLNSSGYYVFNLAVHVLNAFLVYRIAFLFKIPGNKSQQLFGWFSSLLFLLYPFHNEGVAWLTGRLSSISCFFALLSVYLCFFSIHQGLKIGLMVVFYFLGLLAYESILFLPFIVLVLSWDKENTLRRTLLIFAAGVMIITIYLSVRYKVSGVLYGGYGSRIVDFSFLNFVVKASKTSARLFIPPSEHSILFSILFGLLVSAVILLHYRMYRFYRANVLLPYIRLLLCLTIAMVIPILFGISTRTSEGDRLLYFPSVFLCIAISYVLVGMMKKTNLRIIVFSAISIYFLCFLIANNRRWETASQSAGTLVKTAQAIDKKKIIILNMPDEIEGAFVFRNGFNKAMILHGVDTGRIWINNYLSRLEYLELGDKIQPQEKADAIFLPPVSKLSLLTHDSISVENLSLKSVGIFDKRNVIVLYWDKSEMVRLF